VDGHVHFTGGGGEAGASSRVPPLAVTDLTRYGITTAVGLLGTDDVTRDMASLLAAVRGLQEEGISTFCFTGGYHLPPAILTGSVRGDIVHLDRVIGIGEVAISDHRSSQPTLDELLRLAGDAHVAGMMTGKAGVLHLHVGDGARGLQLVSEALETSEIPASVFHPTHVNRRRSLFEEALVLAGHGVTIDLTAFPVAAGDDALSAADGLREFWDRGLPKDRVTVSTDAGGCLPQFDADGRITRYDVGSGDGLLGTIHELVQDGIEVEKVLQPFTTNPATYLRLAGKGILASGADADLVVLDAVGCARDVMALGVWHVRDGKPVVRGAFG
jgi:beta-aspartyl-dipeptidase (metallo-type)